MSHIKFKIVTPERIVFEDTVDAVVLPTTQGEITVLPHHIPLVSLLQAGIVRIKKGDEEIPLAVSSGVIEVNKKEIVVLADSADRADELEEEKIQRARDDAKKLMEEKRNDVEGFAEATAILERELARLKLVQQYRRHASRSTPGPRPDDQQ
ncbi:ATP synthase F1 subunit epsilon [Candidatus Gracilibacteria bacterium]|nr:ATP synthase F1 subunit epsilon [Candidatus Gracilibacteria bacterium]